MTVFQKRYPKLDGLYGWLPARRRHGLDVDDLEDLISWGDFPPTPRDVLTELVWYIGEMAQMINTDIALAELVKEAEALLNVEAADREAQPQRRYQPRNEWRL